MYDRIEIRIELNVTLFYIKIAPKRTEQIFYALLLDFGLACPAGVRLKFTKSIQNIYALKICIFLHWILFISLNTPYIFTCIRQSLKGWNVHMDCVHKDYSDEH